MLNPNLRHLRIFVEIARRGSFRNAAVALHLSEPATSQAIAKLESLLAVKLLDRTTRSVRVTEAGSAFLVDAERLLEGVDHSIATLREFATSGRGRVTLACLSSTVYKLLPSALNEMKRRYPGINVVVRDDNMSGILHSLETGECDVAIVSDEPSGRRGFAIPLVADAFQVVCPADHPLARQRYVSGADLAAHELVLLRRGSGIRDAFDRAAERLAIGRNVVHESAQIHTLLGLVEAGLGVTVLPSMLCPSPANMTLAARPLRRPSIARRLGLVFPAGKEPSFAARTLADVVHKSVLASDLHLPPGVTKIRRP
jgi:LysR family carnitine catabolism transcriptional activator